VLVPDPTLFAFMHLAYFAAAGAFLLAAIGWSVRSWRRAARGGSAPRKLAREEFVWTLAPTLIVIGLTVAGEIPLGWGKHVADRPAGDVRPLRE
jgi:heme/copper-type cytochrome/quinol oxidase subunit 2